MDTIMADGKATGAVKLSGSRSVPSHEVACSTELTGDPRP